MRGGARKGAGRKKLPALLKKEPYSLKLPLWMILKLQKTPKAMKLIYESIIEKTGWTPPNL